MDKKKTFFFQSISLAALLFLIYLQITAIQEYSENPENQDALISIIVYSTLVVLIILISSFRSNKKRIKRNIYGQPIEDDAENENKIEINDIIQQKRLMTKYEEKIIDLKPIRKPLLSQCPNCKFLITRNMKQCPNCGYGFY